MKKILTSMMVAILCVLTIGLVACGGVEGLPTNKADAKSKLESKDYVVAEIPATELEAMADLGVTDAIYGVKASGDMVYVYFFDTAEHATAYKDMAADGLGSRYTMGVEGTIFYMGTEAGVADLKA